MSYFTADSPVNLLLNYANQNISEQDKQNPSAKALYDLITHEESQDLRAYLSSYDVDPIPRKIDEREVFYKAFKKSPPTDIAELPEYKDIFSQDLEFVANLNALYNDWREKIVGIKNTAEEEHIANVCNYLKDLIDNEIYSIMCFMQNLANVPKEIDSLERRVNLDKIEADRRVNRDKRKAERRVDLDKIEAEHRVNLHNIKAMHRANFDEAEAEFRDLLEFKTQKEGEANAKKIQIFMICKKRDLPHTIKLLKKQKTF